MSVTLAFAERKGCIAFHPTMSGFGTESAAFEVQCTNGKFSVGAPLDILWIYGKKEDKFLKIIHNQQNIYYLIQRKVLIH